MLVVRGLTITYSTDVSTQTVVSSLDFEAAPGSVTALIGPSGAGKSSVLRVLAGLQTASAAQVDVERPVALVHQEAMLVRFLTVAENLALSADLANAPLTASRAASILAAVGLVGFEERLPETLSGGEAHRVALARAIGTNAVTLLVDEPTAALDRRAAGSVAGLLERVASTTGATVLVATHDPAVFDQADHVIDLGASRPVSSSRA